MVEAVLVAGSEKAAAHRLGFSHSTLKHHLANKRSKVGATTTAQLVWILAARLPEPEARARRHASALRGTGAPIPVRFTSARSASCRHVATDSAIDDFMTVPRSRPG